MREVGAEREREENGNGNAVQLVMRSHAGGGNMHMPFEI